MDISKIMVATDFSEKAKLAMQYAAAYRDTFKAKLDIVHVSNNFEENAMPIMMDTEVANGKTYKQFILENLESILQAQVEEVKNIPAEEFEKHLYLGNPKSELQKHINQFKPSILFLGYHGHNFINDLIMGSVTEKMLKVSTIPIFVVKEDKVALPKKLFVLVDFSETTEKTLDAAISLAKSFSAQLVLGHLVQADPEVYYSLSEVDGFSSINTVQDLLEKEKEQAEDKIIPLKEKVSKAGVSCNTLIKIAKDFQTAQNLTALADEAKADLLVLAPHSKSWLQKFIFGSTAQRVVEHSSKNLLIVK